MSMHTPGPYVVAVPEEVDDMNADFGFPLGVYVKSDLDIGDDCPAALCYMNDNWGEFKATASLFAASSDMLFQMQQTKRTLENIRPLGDATIKGFCDAAIADLDAAISRATGQPSAGQS